MFYGEEGVDAGGVRKVKCPARKIKMFGLCRSDWSQIFELWRSDQSQTESWYPG